MLLQQKPDTRIVVRVVLQCAQHPLHFPRRNRIHLGVDSGGFPCAEVGVLRGWRGWRGWCGWRGWRGWRAGTGDTPSRTARRSTVSPKVCSAGDDGVELIAAAAAAADADADNDDKLPLRDGVA